MDFNLITLLALAVALLIGAFVGIGLGRRSTKANDLYDRGRLEYQNLLDRAERAEAKLREKAK